MQDDSSSAQEGRRETLEDARREIARLRDALDRQAAEREELLSVVSHELRTPVTVIRGYNNLLLSEEVGALSERQREFLEQSNRSCTRLDRFIGDLLAAAGDPRSQQPEPRLASLDPVLEETLASLRPLLDERGIDVDLKVDRDAAEAWFDPVRIEQVLTNLLVNAIRFSQPGTQVSVRTRPQQVAGRPGVEVSVVDTGPGVPEPDRERVFEPYVRAANDERGGGLGLGLAICKRIVDAHEGAIGVDDGPGGGSRFFFRLPVVSEEGC